MGVSSFIVLLIILILLYFLVKSGAFYKPRVEIESYPNLRVAYKTYIGPYNEAYKQNFEIEKVLNEVNKGLDFSKEPCFCVYYDNPQETPKEKYI